MVEDRAHFHREGVPCAAQVFRAERIIPVHRGVYGCFFFPPRGGPRNPEWMEMTFGPLMIRVAPGEGVDLGGPARLRGAGLTNR